MRWGGDGDVDEMIAEVDGRGWGFENSRVLAAGLFFARLAEGGEKRDRGGFSYQLSLSVCSDSCRVLSLPV